MSDASTKDALLLELAAARPPVPTQEFDVATAQAEALRQRIMAGDSVAIDPLIGDDLAPGRVRGQRQPRWIVGSALGIAVALFLVGFGVVPVLSEHGGVVPAGASSWKLVSEVGWHVQPSIGSDPSALDCPSTSTCYATGLSFPPPYTSAAPQPHVVIEVTHNGGATWHESPLPLGGVSIGSITCPLVNTCMLPGRTEGHGRAMGVMFTTTDGGDSWSSLPLPLTGGFIPLLSCASPLNCVSLNDANGPDGLGIRYMSSATNDGGHTWTSSPLPGTFRAYALQCSSSGRCIAGGYRPTAYRVSDPGTEGGSAAALYSSDDGRTWSPASVPPSGRILLYVSCSDSTHCVGISQTLGGPRHFASHLLDTDDGGKSWFTSSGAIPRLNLLTISCPSREVCWVGGNRAGDGGVGVVYSTNTGGKNWIVGQLPKDGGLLLGPVLGLSCSGRTHCLALANPSTSSIGRQILLSEDGTS
jgi:photosystem II stability/assembly factor-like uncharacterized protein